MELEDLLSDESLRRREFPDTANRVFMAHAGISSLPQAAIDALHSFTEQAGRDHRESGGIRERVEKARAAATRPASTLGRNSVPVE